MHYHFRTLLGLVCCLPVFLMAQPFTTILPGKSYDHIGIGKNADLYYQLDVTRSGTFSIEVFQQGVGVKFTLTDAHRQLLLQSKRPEDTTGLLKKEVTITQPGKFILRLLRYPDPENTDTGKVNILVRQLSERELGIRNKIKKELAVENNKPVQTADIDHFWEAYDHLTDCSSFADSVAVFQQYYLDRATDGLLAFIDLRDLTAEKYVRQVATYPRFFATIRDNTWEVKKAGDIAASVFEKFKAIYPGFKPFKVCFAIGIINTGGTVSDQFILIGSEIVTCTGSVDLSDFLTRQNTGRYRQLHARSDIRQEILKIIAHECVHTQQHYTTDSTAIQCRLLNQSICEGACDFIGELLAGKPINTYAHGYSSQDEKELWIRFKQELCNENMENWLYNGGRTKGKPSDTGYFIGYKIVQCYYEQATDKKRAITEILNMHDPIGFLIKSGYDQKIRR